MYFSQIFKQKIGQYNRSMSTTEESKEKLQLMQQSKDQNKNQSENCDYLKISSDTGRKSNEPKNAIKYQIQIDGLRALAIGPVVLYHFGVCFTGGFLGVDVFFVISGYLISSMIINGYIQKRFSMLTFWQRRIRRLFPAIIFLFVCFSIIGWFLATKKDYTELCREMIFSLLSSANFYFSNVQESGYFAPVTENYPLIHFWSLGVEQQFYFALPISLFFLSKIVRSSGKLFCSIAILYVIVFITSLILSIHFSPLNKNFSFYLIPTRAWELVIGCIVSILCHDKFQEKLQGIQCCNKIINSSKLSIVRKLLFQFMGWTGIALIFSSYILVRKQDFDFPGFIALIPCIGTGLFIFGNKIRYQIALDLNKTRILTTSGRFFSLQPLVFIGKISYSIYLWHWIIWSFEYMYLSESQISFIRKMQLVILTIAISLFSTFIIQAFFRDPKKVSKKMIWAIFIVSQVIMLTYLVISYYKGFHRQISKETVQFDTNASNIYDIDQNYDANGIYIANPYKSIEHVNVKTVKQSYGESYRYQIYKIEGIKIFNEKKGVKPKIAVYGSSHAQMHHFVFQDLSKQFDVPVGFITVSAPKSLFADPLTNFNKKAINQLTEWDLDLLVYFEYFLKFWSQDIHGMASRHFDLLLSTNPKNLVVFGDVPAFETKTHNTFLTYFEKERIKNQDYSFVSKIKPMSYQGLTQIELQSTIMEIIKNQYADKDIKFYPIMQFFLDDEGNIQVLGSQTFGLSLYLDSSHLNVHGSLRLKNYFREKIFGQFIQPVK